MKVYVSVLIMIVHLFFSTSGIAFERTDNSHNVKVGVDGVSKTDTLVTLNLAGKQAGPLQYCVLLLIDVDCHGIVLPETKRIEIVADKRRIAEVRVPISDIEFKNLSISKFVKSRSGFSIIVDWGGGENIYQDCFYFTLDKWRCLLTRILHRSYGPDGDVNVRSKTVRPNVSIEKFRFEDFLE